jgi:hypothetical protein
LSILITKFDVFTEKVQSLWWSFHGFKANQACSYLNVILADQIKTCQLSVVAHDKHWRFSRKYMSYSSKCTVMLSGINHFIVAIWNVFIFPWLLMHQSNPSVPNPSFPTPGHFPVKRVRGLGIWTQTFAAFEIKDLQVLQSSSTCAYAKKTTDMDFCVVFCEWDIDCMISFFPR